MTAVVIHPGNARPGSAPAATHFAGASPTGPFRADWARALAARPEIGLDELNAQAALLARVDRKYLVPTDALPRLLAALPGGARVLAIQGRREFCYESAYYDTPELSSYLLAARRRPRRFKVRVRSYDTGATFSEVKIRDRRGRTVKHRVPSRPISPMAPQALDRTYVAGILAPAGFAGIAVERLQGQLATQYRRATVLVGDSRLTVDTGLTAWRPDGSRTELSGLAVVETKSAGAAGSVDRLLWRCGHRPVRFSKYATSMAALDHELPASRWSAVIRRTGMVAHPGGVAG